MDSFMSLHALAARKGDGLRPELARLLQARIGLAAAGIADLQSYSGAGLKQAGPNPVRDVGAAQPNVIRLPARQKATAGHGVGG
jgi:hypothetical protein